MKYYVMILAMVLGTMATAQKKELKKIEKAMDKKDYGEAQSIFNSIDESAVEDKFKADYTYYKALTMLGNPNRPVAKGSELQEVINLLAKAKEMGFENSTELEANQNLAANAVFSDAQKMLAKGETENALASINFLLDLDPDNQNMRENAANLAYRSENFASAKSNYKRLLDEEYTGSTESVVATEIATNQISKFPNMTAAEFAVRSGKFKDAKIEKSDSKLGTIVTNLAWVYVNDGQKDEAKNLVVDMIKKYPDDMSLKTSSADLYLLVGMQDEYKKAVESLDEDITDPRVFDNLGAAASDKQNWDQAINYYKKSIAINPESYFSQNNIAVAYVNKGNLEETTADEQVELYTLATTHLEKVIILKPEQPAAKQTLLSLYKFLEMNDKAAALEGKM